MQVGSHEFQFSNFTCGNCLIFKTFRITFESRSSVHSIVQLDFFYLNFDNRFVSFYLFICFFYFFFYKILFNFFFFLNIYFALRYLSFVVFCYSLPTKVKMVQLLSLVLYHNKTEHLLVVSNMAFVLCMTNSNCLKTVI